MERESKDKRRKEEGGTRRTFGNQGVGINFKSLRVLLDSLVHQRLGERRLVDFVVAVTAIADYVHDDVLVEFLAPFRGTEEGEKGGRRRRRREGGGGGRRREGGRREREEVAGWLISLWP
jgi:hypothetical protein